MIATRTALMAYADALESVVGLSRTLDYYTISVPYCQ